jgi:hypothetical protein
MTVTATDFRKNLFQLVEARTQRRVGRNRPQEPQNPAGTHRTKSKLSRLVQRDTVNCTPDEFDQAVRAQDDEMRRQWEQKWQSRL